MSELSKVVVTGGAGFIGSHLVDRLVRLGVSVRVVDNLASGSLENVKRHSSNSHFEFAQGDLKDAAIAERAADKVDTVFHLAANPEVRVAEVEPAIHFRENLLATFNVLEAMRKSRTAKHIVFFSSSTVYGEPTELPTSEDYGPLLPISVYGASKLGCEALISSYCHTFNLRSLIFRLANIVGGRSQHGVIVDFICKLERDSKELEILGDGTQTKSYLHVQDLIEAVFLSLKHFRNSKESVEIYNVGSTDRVDVKQIAEIVISEVGLRGVTSRFTGGVDGGRGWKGDVKTMQLSVDKLRGLGWKPALNSGEAVRKSCRELLEKTFDSGV